ncbi:MAG: alpha/beta fold hydrolase [Gammaproteobacteria bacterium]
MVSVSQTVVVARHRGREYRLSAWFRDAGHDLVLFVHGLGCSKESWRHAFTAPAMSGRSLLAIDLPGFGASPRPSGFSYDLAEQAGLLASVVDAHASRRLCLVAHSMGGAIAALLPGPASRRVDGLVLVEGRLLSASCGIAGEVARVDREQFDATVFPRFLRRVATDRRAAFDLDRADRRAFYLSCGSLIRWTGGEGLVPGLAAFDCPVAFVYGSENAHLAELALLDRGVRHEVDGAGHFVMNDKPEAFYPLLASLLPAR